MNSHHNKKFQLNFLYSQKLKNQIRRQFLFLSSKSVLRMLRKSARKLKENEFSVDQNKENWPFANESKFESVNLNKISKTGTASKNSKILSSDESDCELDTSLDTDKIKYDLK